MTFINVVNSLILNAYRKKSCILCILFNIIGELDISNVVKFEIQTLIKKYYDFPETFFFRGG